MDNLFNYYELKVCPKCFERTMELKSVSPTGQSIEYMCLHCSKIINSRILPDRDGSELVKQFNDIRALLAGVRMDLVRNVLNEYGNPNFTFSIQ